MNIEEIFRIKINKIKKILEYSRRFQKIPEEFVASKKNRGNQKRQSFPIHLSKTSFSFNLNMK